MRKINRRDRTALLFSLCAALSMWNTSIPSSARASIPLDICLDVSSEPSERVDACRKAAEEGDASAQYKLGYIYHQGKGVPQDFTMATLWFQKAAEQGLASAQFTLGHMYHQGKGVPQDFTMATLWFRKAAERGLASAQFSLGTMYHKGEGVPQDLAMAVLWLQKAAEQGHAPAQFALGHMYRWGKGVPQDYVFAHMWFNLAASSGYKNALKARNFTAKRMTPQKLAEAQRLAQEWFAQRRRQ